MLKVNANQRYASDAVTEALFARACRAAGVPWQVFVSRNSMPCGSTIGPLTATRLGIAAVDVGCAAVHALGRELCGAEDPELLASALGVLRRGLADDGVRRRRASWARSNRRWSSSCKVDVTSVSVARARPWSAPRMMIGGPTVTCTLRGR